MVGRAHTWGVVLLLIALVAAARLVMSPEVAGATAEESAANQAPVTASLNYLPLAARSGQVVVEEQALCRYGVNYASSASGDNIGNYDLEALNIGWYLNYSASASNAVPSTIEHAAIIALDQPDKTRAEYTTSPGISTIRELAAANPGKRWYIGNEPDRPIYQNDLEPLVYAMAYHDLYYEIKDADPTAQIVAGTIVQATPVRLMYLDMVLEAYRELYREPFPADAWSVHGFVLNEVSCEYDLTNCWGAEVPRGVDVGFGEILGIEDNDNYDLFVERIIRFREWMAERGYRHTPLYLSEFGILMPADYGFDAARVNEFMNKSFTYMSNATDAALGYPYDGNRLVQRWAWYSVADATAFNGWLYSPTSKNLSPMGENFAAFTAAVPHEIDFYPARLTAPAVYYEGVPATLTLYATIANSGNLQAASGPVTVRFYDSNNQQIGGDRTVTLRGCGDRATVSVTWSNRGPGVHRYTVIVDGDGLVAETNENNNRLDGRALVATEQLSLPLIGR